MKRILYTLLSATALLIGNYFFSNGTLEARVETPTPIPPSATPALVPLPDTIAPPPIVVPVSVEEHGPYGEVFLSVTAPDFSSQTDPSIPIDDFTTRLVRLPGSCIVGLIECLALEEVQTPFDMGDAYMIGGLENMEWSPDGRYAALVIHPEDEFTKGWTPEEWEQFKQGERKWEEFQISPSTLYLFDAQTDAWRELYRADRKFFFSLHWSANGEWLAFQVASSEFAFEPPQSDDGLYIIRPDGSGLKNLGGKGGGVLGWIGNSLLLERPIDPAVGSYVVEMLSLDGEVKPMFESSRAAAYSLAPDGGALLAADTVSPTKSVDLLALDGSVIHSFGTFISHTTPIDTLAWSRDGSLIAFASMRRVYVAPSDGPGLPKNAMGVPPETREVYAADDSTSQPQFYDFEFSGDNKYLLIQFLDGSTPSSCIATIALDTGQVTLPLGVPKPTDSTVYQGVSSFSWRP